MSNDKMKGSVPSKHTQNYSRIQNKDSESQYRDKSTEQSLVAEVDHILQSVPVLLKSSKSSENRKLRHRLSVFLMKEEFDSFDKCLSVNKDTHTTTYSLKSELDMDGQIVVADSSKRVADWTDLLNAGSNEEIPNLTNTSNKAILFLRVKDRIFACVFGHGKSLLNDVAIVRRFGLKTAVNAINQDKIRSIDKAKLEELTVLSRVQSSRETDRSSFEINTISDLLRSITGDLVDKKLGNVISGSDAVHITLRIEFQDLKNRLQKLYKLYRKDRYKKNFDWIDNVSEEKDKLVLEILNQDLISNLASKNQADLHLAPPTILDQSTFNGISFAPKGELHDFDIKEYFEYRKNLNELNVKNLKNTKVYFEFTTQEERIPISILKCLNYETKLGDDSYVLTLGSWYKINKLFVDEIDNYISNIPESDVRFIDCESDWNETTYNMKLAESSKELTLFDRDFVKCEKARTVVEACDILSSNKELIHIKPKNISATLSHLFSQGKISAIALNSDKKFRKGMRAIIRKNGDFSDSVIPLDSIKNTDYTITYATITTGDKPMAASLPFFSKLNLRQSCQFLLEHGFDVKVKKIKRLES